MVIIFTKLISAVLNVFVSTLIRINKVFNKAVSATNISNKLIYPYDMVILKEDYTKYILNKVPYVDIAVGRSIFGIVIGIDSYKKLESGLLEPVTVKVAYLNLSNMSLPIVSTYRVEDLMFLISPVESFNKAATLSNLLKDVGISSLYGLDEDFLSKEEELLAKELFGEGGTGNDDDESGGGPIIH